MTDADIQRVYDIYSAYENKVDLCKVVTVEDIKQAGYTLAVGSYIEKKKQAVTPPSEVRKQYFAAVEDVRSAEAKLKELLVKGGYINE